MSSTICLAGEQDGGVIKLHNRDAEGSPSDEADAALDGIRRGFDYNSFESRLESLWFQRKALMVENRTGDTTRHNDQIRAFCMQEGVHRLETMASALLSETDGLLAEGLHDVALESLEFAEFFDPGRPQIRIARAKVYWVSGRGAVATGRELAAGFKQAVVRGVQDFTLVNRLGLVLIVAMFGVILLFSILMLVRHNVALRHEVEEWIDHAVGERWAALSGWAVLGAPLVIWAGVGWCAVFWIVILFRFMTRTERLTATLLLIAGALAIPGYRTAVGFYGVTADPQVRATLASADGLYNPDRVIELQRLVDANPDDATYRFLLASLYRNGRFFEDAFQEYKAVLRLEPSHVAAWINIGNIFYITGQHSEAIVRYRRAAELDPNNVLVWFNLHMAQSEMFRLVDAEKTLLHAREIDSSAVAKMLAEAGERGNRTQVNDAGLDTASVWDAALAGRSFGEEGSTSTRAGLLEQAMNPVSIIFLLAIIGAGASGVLSRRGDPARPCIRCGRPFCHFCKSSRTGREYCSQCLHLFVLGDGLAPEAKRKKIYQIERHERLLRMTRRAVGLIVPGAGQILGGRSAQGALLMVVWFVACILAAPHVLQPFEWVFGIELRLDLLGSGAIPASYAINPLMFIGGVAMAGTWLLANARRGYDVEA